MGSGPREISLDETDNFFILFIYHICITWSELKFDKFVKSRKALLVVIPAKAGIQ